MYSYKTKYFTAEQKFKICVFRFDYYPERGCIVEFQAFCTYLILSLNRSSKFVCLGAIIILNAYASLNLRDYGPTLFNR